MKGNAQDRGRSRREGGGPRPVPARGDAQERAGRAGRAPSRRAVARPRGGTGRGGASEGRASDGGASDRREPDGRERRRAPGPSIPDEVTGRELDREVRAELSSLGQFNAVLVARHLVMVAQLLDTDPALAWQHAVAARVRGARLAVVREAVGLAAYRTGRYAEALGELRTVRRMTGSVDHLPVMADCERGLGRPERALSLAASAEAARLPLEQRIEMQIVASGARADLGQYDAAVLAVQLPELESRTRAPWLSRLRAAYAAALAAAGRAEEAQRWAERAGPWWSDAGDLLDLAADPDAESSADVRDVSDVGDTGRRSGPVTIIDLAEAGDGDRVDPTPSSAGTAGERTTR